MTTTVVVLTSPVTESTAGTFVAVVVVAFAGLVRFTSVEAWARISGDALLSNGVVNKTFKALASSFAVVIRVLGNGKILMHVEAGHGVWPLALDVLHVSSTVIDGWWADLVIASPGSFVAFTDVALDGSGFSGEVLPSIKHTATFAWADADIFVVDDLSSWALTSSDTLFTAFVLWEDFSDVGFPLKTSARFMASITAIKVNLSSWASDFAGGSDPPVFDHDTFLGAGENVLSSGCAGDFPRWRVAVVVFAIVHVLGIIYNSVAWFKGKSFKNTTGGFRGVRPFNMVLASIEVVHVDDFISAFFSFPGGDEVNFVFFSTSSSGSVFISNVVVKVTAESMETSFHTGGGMDSDRTVFRPDCSDHWGSDS